MIWRVDRPDTEARFFRTEAVAKAYADAVNKGLSETQAKAVAWFDCESVGPWAADSPQSHEKGPRSAEEAGSDPSSYTDVVSGPESGDFGEVA